MSEAMTAQGGSSGWHGWPDAFQDMNSQAVQSFRENHRERIQFHLWLQWLAHEQLAKAQRRALAAGMRIGLYLDLAVGVATDGADTWSEPGTVLRGVRVGAPPDAINANGQDWQLAPLSPHALADKQGRLFGALFSDAIGPAGAIRIDHAMGLERLYLIADGLNGVDGAYVQYPLDELLKAIGQVSKAKPAIIIGEDLGTVPANFRETMRAARILGYRVLFFEREWDRSDRSFRLPQDYQRDALACVSTHDLPTLRGWWEGHDLDDRERLGIDDADTVRAYRAERETERKLMIAALFASNLLPDGLVAVARGEQSVPARLPLELAVAITRFLAVTPCRLVAIQLEDLAGVEARANLPGTILEHPNWRRKLPVDLDKLAQLPTFTALIEAVARERPRCGD
ncbi:MAG: 4-alpha-glucanotransferase [Rhodomicrobium sp.]|nr:4-alpha-glucanotransferase [Rhodomicrobium sp.]